MKTLYKILVSFALCLGLAVSTSQPISRTQAIAGASGLFAVHAIYEINAAYKRACNARKKTILSAQQAAKKKQHLQQTDPNKKQENLAPQAPQNELKPMTWKEFRSTTQYLKKYLNTKNLMVSGLLLACSAFFTGKKSDQIKGANRESTTNPANPLPQHEQPRVPLPELIRTLEGPTTHTDKDEKIIAKMFELVSERTDIDVPLCTSPEAQRDFLLETFLRQIIDGKAFFRETVSLFEIKCGQKPRTPGVVLREIYQNEKFINEITHIIRQWDEQKYGKIIAYKFNIHQRTFVIESERFFYQSFRKNTRYISKIDPVGRHVEATLEMLNHRGDIDITYALTERELQHIEILRQLVTQYQKPAEAVAYIVPTVFRLNMSSETLCAAQSLIHDSHKIFESLICFVQGAQNNYGYNSCRLPYKYEYYKDQFKLIQELFTRPNDRIEGDIEACVLNRKEVSAENFISIQTSMHFYAYYEQNGLCHCIKSPITRAENRSLMAVNTNNAQLIRDEKIKQKEEQAERRKKELERQDEEQRQQQIARQEYEERQHIERLRQLHSEYVESLLWVARLLYMLKFENNPEFQKAEYKRLEEEDDERRRKRDRTLTLELENQRRVTQDQHHHVQHHFVPLFR